MIISQYLSCISTDGYFVMDWVFPTWLFQFVFMFVLFSVNGYLVIPLMVILLLMALF